MPAEVKQTIAIPVAITLPIAASLPRIRKSSNQERRAKL